MIYHNDKYSIAIKAAKPKCDIELTKDGRAMRWIYLKRIDAVTMASHCMLVNAVYSIKYEHGYALVWFVCTIYSYSSGPFNCNCGTSLYAWSNLQGLFAYFFSGAVWLISYLYFGVNIIIPLCHRYNNDLLQCGAVITRSIFSQIFTQHTP